MKKRIKTWIIFSILFVFVLILTNSCEKDEIESPYYGNVTGILNDTIWHAKINADTYPWNDSFFTLIITNDISKGNNRLFLWFEFIPKKTGTYNIREVYGWGNNDSVYYTNLFAGTVFEEPKPNIDQDGWPLYMLNPGTKENMIKILNYNISTKEIEGTFNLTLLTRNPKHPISGIIPDTIRLQNVMFYTKIGNNY